MKDRLIFQEIKFANGIRIFVYPMDVPFASLVLTLPLGHVHNTELLSRLDQFRDPAPLKGLYEKYFSPSILGEFLAVPDETP